VQFTLESEKGGSGMALALRAGQTVLSTKEIEKTTRLVERANSLTLMEIHTKVTERMIRLMVKVFINK